MIRIGQAEQGSLKKSSMKASAAEENAPAEINPDKQPSPVGMADQLNYVVHLSCCLGNHFLCSYPAKSVSRTKETTHTSTKRRRLWMWE